MVSAQGGNQAFQNRMLAVETGRSVARAVAIDADGEDFRRDQYGFGGVDAIVDRLQQHVAAAARIPVAVLLDAHQLVSTLRARATLGIL